MVDVAGSIGGVVSPLLQFGEWLAAPIWRQFKYVFNYRSNFNSLQEQVDKLKNTRDEVQRKVTAAERNVQEIKQNVKNWQKDVEKTIIEAEQLIQQKANNPRCFKGLCPNFIIHYKQSKKAFKLKRDDIAPLHQQEKDLDPVSYPTNPPKIWLRSSEDYLAFESRNSTMKNVWDALNDNNVFMTGVYGMGGLGKTTLVQEAGRKAKEEKLFEDIVFVEISESPNIEKIQTTIADNLGLKFKNESDRADELYSRMNGKNILLILDNIWEPLEFEKTIGIPCRADRGRNKLLFTTRDKDVLEKMGSINNYRMDTLNEEEAWILFKKMAGDVIIQTHRLNSLPNDICKVCGGLPLVICTIAKALSKKRQVNQWQEALRELRTPAPTKFPKHLKKEYANIKLSYDYLEDNDELKKTFIISSLMQNDSSISNLLKNVVNLGIFEGVKPTIEGALNKLEVMVDELKDRCLLLDGSNKGRFSMHDVVRVVAVTCGYTDYHVYTEKNTIEREWKDKDKLGQCTIISLVGNDIITQLWSEGLNCPKLEFFQASQMGSSLQIPEGFLIIMPKLRVLNLFEMQQSLLSLSIDRLTNLQTLCLDGSKIEDVTVIRKLKKLKVLSLRNTLIKEFHTNMGQLTQLELLDLSYCRKLEVIAPNVISQLSKLEAFYIKSCSIEWNHGLLEEVKLLSKLTILELDVKDINVFPEGFFSKELKRYNISIGQRWWFHFGNDQLECWRILQFKFNSTTCLEKLHEIKNVEALLLDKSSNEKNDTEASKVILQSNETKPLFNKKVIFTNLIDLKLDNISFGKIWESQLSTPPFENLTRLFLYNCNKIKYVFSIFIAKSLQQLRCLKIHYCKVLEKIVEEEEEEGIEVVNSIFPQITQLELRDLPKLIVFYQRAHALELPLLKELVIIRCPNFTSRYEGFQDNNEKGEVQVSESKSICLKHKINSDLEAIRLKDYWEEKLKYINWLSESKTLEISCANISVGLLQRFYNLEVLFVASDDRLMNLLSFLTYFQNLKILKISYCHGLIKRLITSSMTESLVQLREMSIYDCGFLTEIVENEGDEIKTEIVFNNLNKLSLKNLRCLTCFCSGNYTFNFPSLEELIIKCCPNMKTFFSGSLRIPKLHNVHYRMSWRDEKKLVEIGENGLNTIIQQANKKRVNFALEKLTLSGRDIMPIWQGEFEENFGKVKTLKLINDEHAYIPIHILMKFINLQRLKLKVSSYEEIFSYEEGEEHVRAFAQLKFLKLWGHFNLKCIWKQDFQFKSILQNLCDLTVAYCHNLTTLLPCSSSFKNLTTLEVIYCNGLQNLIASSTAKSLICLEELKIRECEMMIEVLANEGDKEEDEIVFEKLKELTLVKLKSLTYFYSGNCALNFPFLESLNVSRCFKMKTFSRKGLDMPRLQKVNTNVCTDDLNSIIQQLQNDCSEFCDRMTKEHFKKRDKKTKELIHGFVHKPSVIRKR